MEKSKKLKLVLQLDTTSKSLKVLTKKPVLRTGFFYD